MGKKTVIAITVIVLGVFAIYSQRAHLATVLMQRIIDQRLSSNVLTELEDGLHVALCGAGGPLPDPQRSGPCVVIFAGDIILVVDAGTGGVRNLSNMRVPVGKIDTVLLTHFHSDHIDGLGELAMMRWVNTANTSPLQVVGPPGVATVVNGFNQAYLADAGYRHAHHGDEVAPLSGKGMKALQVPAPADGEQFPVFRKNGLIVTMFSVDHHPATPAVGYRFDYKGRSIVVSGDTVKSSNLERMAQAVDVLVHEALSPKLVTVMNRAATKANNQILAKITGDIPDYHTSPVEAAEIAKAANVGHLLFYHVVPPLPLPGLQTAFLEGVASAYDGPVTVGIDGTLLSLPANSDAIIKHRLR